MRLTQEQSFSLVPGNNSMQMRIKTLDKNVYGIFELDPVKVVGSISKVIL